MAQRADAEDGGMRAGRQEEAKQSAGPGLDELRLSDRSLGKLGLRGELLTRGRDDDGGRKGGWGWSVVTR